MDSLEKILEDFKKSAYKPTTEEILASEIKEVYKKVDEVETSILEKIDTIETELVSKANEALEIATQTKKEKGDKGDDYILTSQDKEEIARSIKVPVVDRIIEKTEIIREQPIVTENKFETIKEVALYEGGEKLVEKINDLALEEEFKIDASHIKNLPSRGTFFGGGLSRATADSLYAPIDSQSSSGISESLAIAYAVAL